MLTDISSEMITAILPIYLVLGAGLSPLQFGAIDGLHNGVSAFVRLGGSYLADKWNRHKETATAGYALSALARLGLIVAGSSTPAIATTVLVDRVGKGIRTGPRDALISLTAVPHRLGQAFGVHRSMDTFGAMLGPLLAFALLMVLPGEYNAVFLISFCFAIVGVAVIGLYVRNVDRPEPKHNATTLRSLVLVMRAPKIARMTVVVFALGLATVSDGFLYLTMQRQSSFSAHLFPLLFVGTAISFTIFAIPVGRLADRFGNLKVFVAGYSLLPVIYLAIALVPDARLIVLQLALFGVFYAATDGVLMAYVADLLPEEVRASGLSTVTTASAAGRLVGPLIFGAIWTWAGVNVALLSFALLLAVILAISHVALRSIRVSS